MISRVGFIGIGNMGRLMASNLAHSGFNLFLYNRTRAKAEALRAELKGKWDVTICQSAAEVARKSEVLITMVSDAVAVREIYEGPKGILSTMTTGTVVIEMSTVGVVEIKRLAGRVQALNGTLIDAPVSGSISMARDAQLTIMAGGDFQELSRVRPVLCSMGHQIFHLGPVGSGASMKLAVNAVIFGLNQAISEALVLAEYSGVERLRAYEVFSNSAIAAPFVHYRREAFESPEQAPAAFNLVLAKKDLQLILEQAERERVQLPQTATNLRTLEQALDQGFGNKDISSIAEHLRNIITDEDEATA